MSITLIGVNHRTAPLALRERLALSGDQLRAALADLRGWPSVEEAVILSTCNRLEIYVEGDADVQIEALIAQWGDLALDDLRPHLYHLHDEMAVRHLLRVASGVESMILGESQVLGQVADAMDAAQTSSGAILTHLFAQAVHTGKRARTETEISRHTTSVSHTAAQLARERGGQRVLIIGAGEMATLAAQALAGQEITIINRTYTRAVDLARQVGGRALDWLQFGAALAWADVIISATSAATSIVRAADLMDHSRNLLLIDIALPRNVDPAVSTLANVECWSLDDLQQRIDAHRAQRGAAIPQVEAIVDQETALFLDWLHSREVVPVITELQRWARDLAETEVAQALNRLDTPDPRTEQVITRLAHRLVNKMLHEPTVRLKLHAAEGDGQDYADALRDLFGLESEVIEHVP